jgi:peptidyl-tRNA hydrolase, PTH1 family
MTMLLLVGLGNPGAQYVGTRHNLGLMAVTEIAKRHEFPRWRPFHDLALVSEGSIDGEPVSLILPKTYMNDSGRAVAAAAKSNAVQLKDIVVFHDDIERRPGIVKVKINGGDRGHNGLRSITSYVGKEYRRVQIGVGRPEHKDLVESYVLGRFFSEEKILFDRLISVVAEKIYLLVRGDDTFFEERVTFAMKKFGPWLD